MSREAIPLRFFFFFSPKSATAFSHQVLQSKQKHCSFPTWVCDPLPWRSFSIWKGCLLSRRAEENSRAPCTKCSVSYKSDKTPGGFQPSRACRYSSGRIKNKQVLCCTLIEGKWVTYVKQRLKVKALQYPVCVLTAKAQECTMIREMGKRERFNWIKTPGCDRGGQTQSSN